jgi:D-3-phosphoglycerate dehydrogenase
LFDFGLLDAAPSIRSEVLDATEGELAPDAVSDLDAIVIASSRFRVSRNTIRRGHRLALIARLGAGYETIDVEVCTEAGIAITTSPDAVRRPMATAAIAFLLALTLKIPQKDRYTREGRWSEGATDLGVGLTEHRLGIVGLGNIGSEIARLASTLSIQVRAHDPWVDASAAGVPNVALVELDELLAESDTVVISCPLTAATRGLLDEERLALMKPTAFLINIARGPIVDQDALLGMLRSGRLAGAALDVFEEEPIDPVHPLLHLPNVIATPHAIGWTDEACRIAGRSASTAVVEIAAGRIPENVLNPEVFDVPAFAAKLALREASREYAQGEGVARVCSPSRMPG